MQGWRTIQLPEDLCDSAEKQWSARFGSIEDLLTFFLEELSQHEAIQLDEHEEQGIEQRLRELGYM
jgi:hypothetical protein